MIEIKRFIMSNLVFILIGTILIGGGYAVASNLLDRGNPNMEQSEVKMDSTGETGSAYFQFFAELPDGQPFANTGIMEQYLRLESTLEDAAQATGVPVDDIIAEERAVSTPQSEWVIALTRNEHTRLHTLNISVGDEAENLAVAQFYFDMIQNDEVPFLANKEVHIFEEPQLIEVIEESTSESEENTNGLSDISLRSLAIDIVFGALLGIVLMTGIAVLRALFSKKLKYSFSYSRNEEDDFILADDKLANEDEIKQLVTLPLSSGKVVLTETELSDKVSTLLTNGENAAFNIENSAGTRLIEKHSLAQLDAGNEITEVIMVVESNVTTRAWYRKQRRLLSAYNNTPVKVIQVNH